MENYYSRIIDLLLQEELDAMGAVLIEGPKACGKTTSAEQAANSVIFMDDPLRRNQYLQMVETDMRYILDGPTPRLIDEWQIATKIWDGVRYEVDHRHADGQFILTGSAVPPAKDKEEMKHTGTGRIAWLTMRPMSVGAWRFYTAAGAEEA